MGAWEEAEEEQDRLEVGRWFTSAEQCEQRGDQMAGQ